LKSDHFAEAIKFFRIYYRRLNIAMSYDIRKYIDIVEGFGVRQIPQRSFGMRGTTYRAQEPTDPDRKAELDRCRKFRSAEAYDMDQNPYLPVSGGDPKSIRDRADNESARLQARWNHWREMGLI
jgi:hypothetical protein